MVDSVKKTTYLGSAIDDEWDHCMELKCRIEKARVAFMKMSTLLKNHD